MSKDPDSRLQLTAETPKPPTHHPRSRNVFILKSLSIILTLTVIVLGINYYLISNCPSETTSAQGPNSSKTPSALQNTNELDTPPNKITVSVYYEILCPDSKSFILNQLVPAYRKYGHLINLRYVPFGKAKYWGDADDLKFSCQHGEEECHGNKLHACILETHATNEQLQTEIIACSMTNYRLWGSTLNEITKVTEDCRQKHAPDDTTPILCRNASTLLAKHGRETLALRPSVSFIPTISIDGSQNNQRQILRSATTVICKLLKQQHPDLTC